jgi:hypothetical protein
MSVSEFLDMEDEMLISEDFENAYYLDTAPKQE